MDQATIRAENEFQLGLVPDAVQVRLLRMSVHSVAEMTEMATVKESKKEAKESGDGDQVLKTHLFEEFLTTERKYVEDLDGIIKVNLSPCILKKLLFVILKIFLDLFLLFLFLLLLLLLLCSTFSCE
jgi:hypothetical protein